MAIIREVMVDIARCPQCNTSNPTLNYQHHFYNKADHNRHVPVWFTYSCSKCKNLVAAWAMVDRGLFNGNMMNHLENRRLDALGIIPDTKRVDADLPEKPRIYLEQALESVHAPDGAVMLAGSAVDAMLKLKGYTDGSVFKRIEQAVADHLLTSEMSEWAHAVRLESNKPRHADLEEPHATTQQARQVIEFAQALGEFLFVLPARIAKGKAEAEQSDGTN